MVTNVTENKPIKKNKTSNTNKMWFTTFSNMRSIMVLLVLVKMLYLLEKIVCYIKLKIIPFFLLYKVCDVNSISANLRNLKPWTIFQNSWILPNFP